MITVLVLSLALAFILYLMSLMRRRRAEMDPTDLYWRLRPIHLPALLNLLNPDDINFLRTNLRQADFLKLKRQRTRALMDYVRKIALNAAVLTSIGMLYRNSPVPEIAASGQFLAARALTTRILALRTLLCLQIELVLPGFNTNMGSTIKAYEAARVGLDRISSNPFVLR
jgi:hypothetical protein